MEFCRTRRTFTLDRDNCLLIICYTVLTMYMADNRLLDMYSYTFYPLHDPPHKSPTTHSTQGSQRGDRAWVRGQGQKLFSLPHVVPKFLLLGLMLIGVYWLNIPGSIVLSTTVKLSHMGMLKSDLYTTFNWTCIISLLPAFYSYKKTEMYNMNVILGK